MVIKHIIQSSDVKGEKDLVNKIRLTNLTGKTTDGTLVVDIDLNHNPHAIKIGLVSYSDTFIGEDVIEEGYIHDNEIGQHTLFWEDSLMNDYHNRILQVADGQNPKHNHIAPKLVQIGHNATKLFMCDIKNYIKQAKVIKLRPGQQYNPVAQNEVTTTNPF